MNKRNQHGNSYHYPVADAEHRRLLVWWFEQWHLHHPDINLILVSGVSGTVLGTLVSDVLNIPMLVIRQEELKHKAVVGETNIGQNNAVIIDDLIDTGKTVRRIIEEVASHPLEVDDITVKHIVLYRQHLYHKDGFEEIKKVYGVTISRVSEYAEWGFKDDALRQELVDLD